MAKGRFYNDIYPGTSFIPVAVLDRLNDMGLVLPDLHKIRRYRKRRIVEQLNKRDLDAVLLFDPVNIRYATDSSNMQVWTAHNLARAALVTACGYVILWDFTHCDHLTTHLNLIDEIRSGAGAFYFEHGDASADTAEKFCGQVIDVLRAKPGGLHLAIDRMDTAIAKAFLGSVCTISDAWPVMEHARLIKSGEEINAMRCAIAGAQIAMSAMEAALRPGISEVELWSILHGENIRQGGEWIETRLLCSGPRTNPWMSEASGRILCAGDLLAFDTDMIGMFGICCDISRTWLVGDGEASAEQITLYKMAHEHVETNMKLLKPGTPLRDLTFNGHELPKIYQANKYCVKMHGVGLADEFPSIYYQDGFIEGAADYTLQPGMTLCVEAFIGREDGGEGVKLENQVLITETGFEKLSTYPYDRRLLGG